MNQAHFIGRLTKDPEYRSTPNGVSVCTFSVAVPKRKDRDKANYIQVVAWRELADNCQRYLSKGKQVGVSGEITSRSYDKENVRHYVTEVVADSVDFLSPKDDDSLFPGDPDEQEEPEEEELPLNVLKPYTPPRVIRTKR